jgi:deazaflavin-dependent oxidoreductase (nitroreductase family)
VSRSRAQGRLPLVPRNDPREARGGLLACLQAVTSLDAAPARSASITCVKDRAAMEASDVTIRVNPRHSRRAGADCAREAHRQAADPDVSPQRRAACQLEGGVPRGSFTTRGAKTGRTRTAPVGGFPDGENSWLVAAMIGGAAGHRSWFLNMAKHPDDIWLEVGTEQFKVRGESLEGQERAEALARIAKIAPRYGKYQEKTDREIPIVRLTREP